MQTNRAYVHCLTKFIGAAKIWQLLFMCATIIALVACSRSPQDRFIGKWTYSANGKLMTIPLKCSIDLEISKDSKTKAYILNTLSLHLTPAVFGLNGGEFFKNAKLSIQDNNTMLTPALAHGSPIKIILNSSKQIQLIPNPCNGIAVDGILSQVK
jgi:hypothetical protein